LGGRVHGEGAAQEEQRGHEESARIHRRKGGREERIRFG
jgi:hypothetical protein